MPFLAFVPVITFLSLLPLVSTQTPNNGDVKLTGNANNNTIEGALWIYLNDGWGTICLDGFNIYAAHAACRELGYVKAINFVNASKKYQPTNETTQVLLSNVHCPSVKEPQYNAEWHLLRCQYNLDANNCAKNNIVGIQCDTTQLHITPYDTQVWLLPESHPSKDIVTPSNGVLRVYLNGMWGLVCYNGFTKTSADTVCLQRGFTNAFDAPYGRHLNNSETIWLSDVQCSSVQSCFYKCFHYPDSSDSITSCDDDLKVNIRCTFDLSRANSTTPGSYVKCNYSAIKFGRYLVSLLIGVIVSSVIIILIIIIIIFITCCVVTCCPIHMYRKRRYYRAIV